MTNDEVRALIEAGRKHDEAMADGPWEPSEASPGARRSEVRSIDPCHPDYDMRVVVTGGDNETVPVNRRDAVPNANGIAWMRTNLRALLDLADLGVLTNERDNRPFGPGQRDLVLEVCHDLINRAMRNECDPVPSQKYAADDRAKEAAIRALLDGYAAALDAETTLAKQALVTQDQLDKFMSACADQTIQIMELRGETVRLRTENANLHLECNDAADDAADIDT